MAKKTIDQVEVEGQRVLMRVDFNVPIGEDGRIANDGRIVESLASIKSVIERGGKLILMSHLGRPEGTGYEAHLSLNPVAERLQEMLPGVKVTFPGNDCVGPDATKAIESMENGEVIVLENLRFHAEEQKNDPAFAAKFAAYADIYCNEAFGTAHRHDASMLGVPQQMEGKPRVAGFLIRKELRYLSDSITNAEKPFIAVLGGAKVSDKLGAIRNLMNKVDSILVGGAMAYTFLKALQRNVGSSLVQLGMVKQAEEIMDEANASRTELILPQDHVCGRQVTHMTPVKIFNEHIEDGWMGLDIGPKTTGAFSEVIHDAKTIVWNGPMGVYETKPFDVGTRRVAEAIAQATVRGATSIVGGGDSISAVHAFGLADKFSHVSTGGGASLQMLEGRAFDTVNILDDV